MIWRKYAAVAEVNLRSRLAYLWDQLISNLFLIIIIYVFVKLWQVTYAAQGSGTITGYTLPQMIWYLVATEAIIFSLPRTHATLEQEVREGDLALRLNKPYSYLLFHYSASLGEGLFRLFTGLLLGGLTAYLMVGGIPFSLSSVSALLIIYLLTQGLHFCYGAAIGLAAFWTEDITGLFFLFDRVKWILGGLLLPIEVFPAPVRAVAELLPFQHMLYGPARLFVKFSWDGAGRLAAAQALWLTVFAAVCAGLYRLGVRRVDINGG